MLGPQHVGYPGTLQRRTGGNCYTGIRSCKEQNQQLKLKSIGL